ncbi:hypothetical protein K435DRAFT_871889 [Dendrothele bispora CBS 962.96]|uniref:Uncharacterized protein n=1 Tax=Dendrothele bispora (strain CBS 962.96) TaxID=1314807 RepID=A0A4S8L308_DENBC|nr:hypothetical protein K435DRAFT_871889 [Dendrothele bispora CBS 962.96]
MLSFAPYVGPPCDFFHSNDTDVIWKIQQLKLHFPSETNQQVAFDLSTYDDELEFYEFVWIKSLWVREAAWLTPIRHFPMDRLTLAVDKYGYHPSRELRINNPSIRANTHSIPYRDKPVCHDSRVYWEPVDTFERLDCTEKFLYEVGEVCLLGDEERWIIRSRRFYLDRNPGRPGHPWIRDRVSRRKVAEERDYVEDVLTSIYLETYFYTPNFHLPLTEEGFVNVALTHPRAVAKWCIDMLPRIRSFYYSVYLPNFRNMRYGGPASISRQRAEFRLAFWTVASNALASPLAHYLA